MAELKFCQCLAILEDEECNTHGCPYSKDPPITFSNTLVLGADGLIRPSWYKYDT